MEPKECTKCGIEKKVDEFYHHNGRPVQPCKACKKAYIQNIKYEEDPNYPMVTIKRGRGRPKKNQIILEESPRDAFKEEPIIMQKAEIHQASTGTGTKNKIIIMDMSVFHTAIRLAFEKGKFEGKEFDELKIKEMDLEPMLEQILEETPKARKES